VAVSSSSVRWRRSVRPSTSDAPLPLPEICVAALNECKARQDEWQGSGLVVSTRYGMAMEPRNFHRDFKRRCAKAGVRPISVQSTRRTCASLLVALDVHPRVAMQILRHSQIAVTMNVYSEVFSAETREALRRLGARLGKQEP
jgi:integrase